MAACMQHAQAALRAPAAQRALLARRPASVVCMAHPRRVAKVAKQIEREVGQLLISDRTMQAAVCPERARSGDGALSALASVTEVQISNDLQVAKVYLSIYSDEAGKAAAMEGLQRLEGYVRKHIGRQIRLRLTPEIRFVRDDSIERSERILALLEQVKRIDRGEAEPPPLAVYGDEEDEEEGEGEGGDELELEQFGGFDTVDLGLFGGGGGGGGGAQGAAPRQQRRAPGGGARQQQRRRQQQQQRGDGGEEEEEDVAEMLAAFRQRAEARGWRQG